MIGNSPNGSTEIDVEYGGAEPFMDESDLSELQRPPAGGFFFRIL